MLRVFKYFFYTKDSKFEDKQVLIEQGFWKQLGYLLDV